MKMAELPYHLTTRTGPTKEEKDVGVTKVPNTG